MKIRYFSGIRKLRYEQFERLKHDAFILQSLRMSIRIISIIFNQKLAEHAELLIKS